MSNLVKCKSCDHDVSPKAKACPNCGAPVKKKIRFLKLLCVVAIICLIVWWPIIRYLVSGSDDNSNSPVGNNDSQSEPAQQQTEQPSISLSCLYAMPFGANGTWLISEYKNTGNVGILAFKGKWTLVDDLGDSQGELEDEYTSETPFIDTLEGTNSPVSHVIAPGETIEIIDQVYHFDSGDEQKFSATTKANFIAMVAGFGITNLDDIRRNKKITFEIEKIVPQ